MELKQRAGELLEELARVGLHWKGGDKTVVLDDGEQRSVDMLAWCSEKGCGALVELKWTRGKLRTALGWGRHCYRKTTPITKPHDMSRIGFVCAFGIRQCTHSSHSLTPTRSWHSVCVCVLRSYPGVLGPG